MKRMLNKLPDSLELSRFRIEEDEARRRSFGGETQLLEDDEVAANWCPVNSVAFDNPVFEQELSSSAINVLSDIKAQKSYSLAGGINPIGVCLSLARIDNNETTFQVDILESEEPSTVQFQSQAPTVQSMDNNNTKKARSDRSNSFKFERLDDRPAKNVDLEEGKDETSHDETPWAALGQLVVAFLIAGLGNVAAGVILTRVQTWPVFTNIPQLLILVQPLLGLKGNVEMTLASRLSTHANIGDMDSTDGRRTIIKGNMALVQCQASTVGFIAPIIALLLSFASADHSNTLTFQEIILLGATSVITANIANLLLGSVMCGVVVLSRKWNINPDNIATPIAASLGDFTTMLLLAYISHFLYINLDNSWLQDLLLVLLLACIPFWAYIARKNPFTSSVIVTGWIPILSAMLLQNAGGLIMERALGQFKRIAAFQPVINGVGGNLVAIQSSRMSTHLHKYGKKRQLPETDPSPCISPCTAFFGSRSPHSMMARLLLALAGPGHLFFLFITWMVNKNFYFTPAFLSIYLAMALLQVAILLNLAYFLVHWMWRKNIDPDNSSIPFLTAFADLIGSVFLATVFVLLLEVRDKNAFDEPSALVAFHFNVTEGYGNSMTAF